MTPEYVIRPGALTDLPFVADAWVQSYRASSRATKMADKEWFFRVEHRRVERLVQRSVLRVAAPAGDDITAYGFAVVEPNLGAGVVHFVYVKKPWRRLGIAQRLLEGIDLRAATFTYWSRDMSDWIREKHRGLHFNPYFLEMTHG